MANYRCLEELDSIKVMISIKNINHVFASLKAPNDFKPGVLYYLYNIYFDI